MAHLAEPTTQHASHIPIPETIRDKNPTTATDAILDAIQSEPTIQDLYSLKGRTALGTLPPDSRDLPNLIVIAFMA